MAGSDSTIVLDDERKQEIKLLVCDILEIDPEAVTETSIFTEEHGADSLRAIEILAALERTCRVEIDQAELDRMGNLAGIYAVVSEAAGR